MFVPPSVRHDLLMRSAGLILLSHGFSVHPLGLVHVMMSTLCPFLSGMHAHFWLSKSRALENTSDSYLTY
eukprot:s162_g15.t1